MSQLLNIKVPDIGDFKDVPVIEVLVKVGDSIAAEDPLLTLESDKATIDVPAPHAGVVREVKLKVGDKVSEGSLVAVLEVSAGGEAASSVAQGATQAAAQGAAASVPAPTVTAAATSAAPVVAPAASDAPAAAGSVPDDAVDLLVLGAGPGGYSAAFRAADLGLKVVLVERHATLGGVCLNVGCIPSKALLHVAGVIEEARAASHLGVTFAAPQINLAAVREYKEGVVGKLTQGLAAMARARKVEVVRGNGQFVDAHHLKVDTGRGERVIAFKQAIIAAGSEAVKLPFLPDDARIVSSTGALALAEIPKRMLVIGGGIIGLEMATVYAALGAAVSIVEMTAGLMPGVDRDLVKVFEKQNAGRFASVMLETRVTAVEASKKGLKVSFDGQQAPTKAQEYDLILVATGRRPNGKTLGLAAAGVVVDERGYIPVDRQQRTNLPHIYAIGDIVGQPMLAHKAVHEAHVAAEVAAGHKAGFDALVIPSVAYTHPEVAWVGLTEEQARTQGVAVEKGLFPWAASGRALANGAEYGFTKLLFDASTRRIVGGAIVGPSAGDMIGEIALAIELGADAIDIGRTIHPHPTLGETIGLAAEALLGCCTDLPAARKSR